MPSAVTNTNSTGSGACSMLSIPTAGKKLTAVDLNTVGDTAITGLPAKWIPVAVYVYDVSASLAILATVAGLFTQAGGAGSNLVSAITFTSLTGATKIVNATMAAVTDYQTATTIYFRPTVPAGSAATATVLLEYKDLT